MSKDVSEIYDFFFKMQKKKNDFESYRLFSVLVYKKIVGQNVHFYLDYLYFVLDFGTKNTVQTQKMAYCTTYSARKNFAVIFLTKRNSNMIWKTFTPKVEWGMYRITKKFKKMMKCIMKYWKNHQNKTSFYNLICRFRQSF